MATKKWIGTTDSNTTTAANYLPAGEPAAGDIIVIPSDATVDFGNGAVAGSTITNASGGFIVEPGCSVAIGTGSSPILITMQASKAIKLSGSGVAYLNVNNDATGGTIRITEATRTYLEPTAAGVELCDDLEIDIESGEVHVGLSGSLVEVDTISVGGEGEVYLGSGLEITGGTHGAVTSLTTSGEEVHIASNVATINCNGGELLVEGTAAVSTALNANDGVVKYLSSGTLALGNIYAGDIDLTENDNASVTVTAIKRYGAGKYLDPNSVAAAGTVIDNYYTNGDDDVIQFGRNTRITTAAIA